MTSIQFEYVLSSVKEKYGSSYSEKVVYEFHLPDDIVLSVRGSYLKYVVNGYLISFSVKNTTAYIPLKSINYIKCGDFGAPLKW